MRNRIALAVVVLLALPAFGVDKDGLVLITGPAHEKTCGDWHEAARYSYPPYPERRTRMRIWIFGYISGVNNSVLGSAVGVPDADIDAYMDHYCANNPLHNLAGAANALIQDAGGPKAAHTWRK